MLNWVLNQFAVYFLDVVSMVNYYAFGNTFLVVTSHTLKIVHGPVMHWIQMLVVNGKASVKQCYTIN